MTNSCFSQLLRLTTTVRTKTFCRVVLGGLVVSGFFRDPVYGQTAQKHSSVAIHEGSCDSSAVKTIRRVTELYVKKSSKGNIDWTTMASTYTHDPQGQRVDQFSTGIEPVAIERPDFVRSGYRHTRSTLQAGSGADHYHSVEQWGPNVRPYGEWRYPTRPFSVPYPVWGPQLPQVLGGGFPWGGVPFGNATNGGSGNGLMPGVIPQPGAIPQPGWQSGFGTGLGVGPGNALLPMQDDYYPPAPVYNPPATGLDIQ